MTIPMPDSITPGNLPPGYPAYLGYADGRWPTAAGLRARFPGAHILTLTVTGATDNADGCDQENGDLDPDSAAMWLKHQLLSGKKRPVLYASRDNVPLTLSILAPLGTARDDIRILSAHYGQGEHICSPSACGASFTADGTQWTDQFAGLDGSRIDMSALDDGFFGAPVPPVPIPITQWTEFDMTRLPILRQGAADVPGGGFWHVHRLQALLAETGALQGIGPARGLAGDGAFGPATAAAVRAVQEHYGIAADGIAGAQTWSVLLTGAPS